MTTGRDIARLGDTRVMPVVHRAGAPRADAVMIGTVTELIQATHSGTVRAVGRYVPRPDGRYSVPVVYVSKRATPWHERRWVHVTCIVVGAVLILAALITWAILSVGMAWFAGSILAGAVVIAFLVRFARGGGGRRSVSVTTTTSVRVR